MALEGAKCLTKTRGVGVSPCLPDFERATFEYSLEAYASRPADILKLQLRKKTIDVYI